MLFLCLISASCTSPPPQTKPSATNHQASNSKVQSILRDPLFARGVRHGNGNTYPGKMDRACRDRWNRRLEGLGEAVWRFTEIAEKTYFCENPNTPTLDKDRLIYESKDRSKRFMIRLDGSGTVRYLFDSSKEWRQGCQLNLPNEKAEKPVFGSEHWNWCHFLVGQPLADDHDEAGKVRFERYGDIRFQARVKLNDIARSGPECEERDGVPNHALFYIGFVLKRKAWTWTRPRTFYALVNAFYSKDGENHHEVAPWLGSDPVHAAVFFSPGYPALVRGTEVDYNVSVKTVANRAITAYNEKHKTSVLLEDYTLSGILIGWEIWGGYRTDVEMRGLALNGIESKTGSGKRCQDDFLDLAGHDGNLK